MVFEGRTPVSSSAAVPVFFSPVVIENFYDKCPLPLPEWVERVRRNTEAPPMLRQYADAIVRYRKGDVKYVKCSDEHGVIEDPGSVLKVGDKLRLVPRHCDPTCNVHDWYVGVRNGKVECVWPISARGKGY